MLEAPRGADEAAIGKTAPASPPVPRLFLIFAGTGGGPLIALHRTRPRRPDGRAAPVRQDALLQAGVLAGLPALGPIVTLTWYLFDLNVAKPIEGLAGSLRARTHADVERHIDPGEARYLGDLAPAAAAAALTLARNPKRAGRGCRARDGPANRPEKSRLEALLADVPVGGSAVFGRTPARLLQRSGGRTLSRARAVSTEGLFEYLREGPVRHRPTRAFGKPAILMPPPTCSARRRMARISSPPGCASFPPMLGPRLCSDPARRDRRSCRARGAREALLSEVFDRPPPLSRQSPGDRRPAQTAGSSGS